MSTTKDRLSTRFARSSRAARQRLREEAMLDADRQLMGTYEPVRDDNQLELPWEQDKTADYGEMAYADELGVN